jgi:cytoskeletal protein RodZ
MAARMDRGWSVEDVAFKTHIPASRLRELENDDFSNFANLTYAKGFLKIYSNYLELDLSEYLDQFNTSEFANISGHDYIQSANTGLTTLSMAVANDKQERRGSAVFGIVLLGITLIGLPLWLWLKPKDNATDAAVPTTTGSTSAPKPRIVEDTPAETPSPSPAAPPQVLKAQPAPEPTDAAAAPAAPQQPQNL